MAKSKGELVDMGFAAIAAGDFVEFYRCFFTQSVDINEAYELEGRKTTFLH